MGRRAVACPVLALLLGACSVPPAPAPAPPSAEATASVVPPAVDCASSVRSGPLPEWARDGFTGDGSSFRHVEGLHGSVVGVLFGYPLSSPPRPDRANKILWVARDPVAGRIAITARLDDAGPPVLREVGLGGGQSVVDLPGAGCWRLTLRWGDGVSDVVDVPYVAPR